MGSKITLKSLIKEVQVSDRNSVNENTSIASMPKNKFISEEEFFDYLEDYPKVVSKMQELDTNDYFESNDLLNDYQKILDKFHIKLKIIAVKLGEYDVKLKIK